MVGDPMRHLVRRICTRRIRQRRLCNKDHLGLPLHLFDHSKLLGILVVDALVPLMFVLLVLGVYTGDAEMAQR